MTREANTKCNADGRAAKATETRAKCNKVPRARKGLLYSWPMGAWLVVFFVAPIVIIVVYSVLKKGLYGGVEWQPSLKAYAGMLNPKYGALVLRTLRISVTATVITMLLALPSGYAIARSSKQTFYLFLVIIPFWTNSLIRVFAWMSILNNDGVLNQILMALHIEKDYTQFLYNQWAVILVSVYMYVPYAILPIFSAIDKFDFSLLEAARDLGAPKHKAVALVMLPGIKAGILTAVIFTFIPIFGSYTVPLLVGGKDSYMLGNIIVDQVQKTRNWPLAAAFSMVITIISMAGILVMEHTNSTKDKREARL